LGDFNFDESGDNIVEDYTVGTADDNNFFIQSFSPSGILIIFFLKTIE